MPGSDQLDLSALDSIKNDDLRQKILEAINTGKILEDFMNSVDDGFSILDKDLRYITINETLEKRLGKRAKDIIGKEMGEVAPQAVRMGRVEQYKKVLVTGEPVTFDRVLASDGEMILRIYAFKSGEHLGLITRDITDIVDFEDKLIALQKHSALLAECDSIAQVYDVTINAMSNILKHNASDILMVENGHLVQVASDNLPLDLKIPLTSKGLTVKAINQASTVLENDVRSNSEYIDAEQIMGGLDEEFPYSQSELVTPLIIDGDAIGVLNIEGTTPNAFTNNDRLLLEILALQVASAMKSIHDFRTQLNLHKELFEHQAKIEQAEEMNRLKTNFMSTATHEIRTPITSIKGYADMIIEDIDELPHDTLVKYLEVIQRNVDRLEHLSDDLLENMRIEIHRAELNISERVFSEIVSQVIQEIDPIITPKGQSIELSYLCGDITVFWDEARINQVLTNLITNASYYSGEGSTIRIDCGNDGDEIWVKITDQGIGLTKEDISKLFIPFPDIESPPFRRGTGLGLSICKGIIELHNGEIYAESEGLGTGTTVTFRIPRNPDHFLK